MTQLGFHHHHRMKHAGKKLTKGQRNLNQLVDATIYIMATLGALVFVPQMIDVWTRADIGAVSLFSWFGMLIGSLFWIIYGLVHQAKPIIYSSVLGAGIQLLIIVGILVH